MTLPRLLPRLDYSRATSEQVANGRGLVLLATWPLGSREGAGPAGSRRAPRRLAPWCPGAHVTTVPLRRQASRSPQKTPLKCPRRCSAPASVSRRETEAGRANGFSPSRLHSRRDHREGRGDGEGVESKRGLGSRPTLPHSRWRRGRGEVPQRRYQRMRSAESRPGTQDGGSGAGEGEAEAAKRAVEQNVWPRPLESASGSC